MDLVDADLRLATITRKRLVEAARPAQGPYLCATSLEQQAQTLTDLHAALSQLAGVRPMLYAWRMPIPGDPERRTVDLPRLALDLGSDSFSLGFAGDQLCLFADWEIGVPVTGVAQLQQFVATVREARDQAHKRALKRGKIRALQERAIRAAVTVTLADFPVRYRLDFPKGKARLDIEIGSYELSVDIPYDDPASVLDRLGTLVGAAQEVVGSGVPFSLYRLR